MESLTCDDTPLHDLGEPPASHGTISDVGDRLHAFPQDALRKILHHVGRPVRRVCRHWRATYNRLPGLYLDHPSTETDLLALFPPPCRNPHPRILYLASQHAASAGTPDLPQYQDAPLASLPITFPTLRALHLNSQTPLSPEQVQRSFSPTLTALTVCIDPSAAAHLHVAVPALRSLALSCPCAPEELFPELPHLAALSATLCDLDLSCYGFEHLWRVHKCLSAQALIPLAALTHLTRLRIRPYIAYWDPPSVDLLATAWPHLASFDAVLHLDNDNALLDAFGTALARRTALTSLSFASSDLPPNLAALTNLRHLYIQACMSDPATIRALTPLASDLTALTRVSYRIKATLAPSAVGAPLPTFGHLSAVTQLSIVRYDPLAPNTLDVLAPLAPTLRRFTLSGCTPFVALQPLSHLTRLRSLDLRCETEPSLPVSRTPPNQQVARRIGAALSHLTSLSMETAAWSAGPDTLLAAVAAHGRLRHVRVNAGLARIAECLAPASNTLTRLHCFLHPSLDAIRSLADLEALHYLSCQFVLCSSRSSSSASSGQRPEGQQQQQQQEQQQGARRARLLPRQLRVLCCNLEQLLDQEAGQAVEAATAADSNCSMGVVANTAGAGAGATSQVVGVGPSSSAHGQRAGHTASADHNSSGSNSASSRQLPEGQQQQQEQQEQQRGARRARILPRQLRVLCCDLEQLLDQGARQAVEAAAAQQECVVCRAYRLPQYDDCNGYLDGAAPEFRRWGDDEVASGSEME